MWTPSHGEENISLFSEEKQTERGVGSKCPATYTSKNNPHDKKTKEDNEEQTTAATGEEQKDSPRANLPHTKEDPHSNQEMTQGRGGDCQHTENLVNPLTKQKRVRFR